MTRILFFVFLAFLVWLLFRVLGAQRRRGGSTVPRETSTPERPPEAMAQCAWCGAHLPTSQAIVVADGRSYCSTAHREAAGGS